MKKDVVLNNWSFYIIDPNNNVKILDAIKNGVSINFLKPKFSPFSVPGTLQSNIARLNNINPYYERNMKQFEEYESSILVLYHQFNLENEIQEDLILFFENIDTVAEIYLNNQLIGKTSNAFQQYEIQIPSENLLQGLNYVLLIIYPAISFVPETTELPEIRDRVFIRRPAYNFGWDFAPRAVLCGIGETWIKKVEILQIKDLFIFTERINNNQAKLSIKWSIKSQNQDENYLFLIKILDESGKQVYSSEFEESKVSYNNYYHIKVNLQNPQLWFPNGVGNQPLYNFELVEKTTETSIRTSFGIRTVRLLTRDNGSNVFIFEINGYKIWAKGANWVPTDALTNYSTKMNYERLLTLAKEANFNMLRVWGGGIVEKEDFYELCDRLGLLIWHDFQFACSIYPETDDFLNKVEAEISFIVKKLRNHPSIVLWCGNNENEWIYYQKFNEHYQNGLGIGTKLHKVKEKLCSELDPSRPYWRSSPWSQTVADPNSQSEGNTHDWFVWHGIGFDTPPQYEEYLNNNAKFITEFGIQSLPSKETIDKIFNPISQSAPNETWLFHNMVSEKIKINMIKFGEPRDIDEWIIFSQTAQAFGIKLAIETWRSRKYEIAGALVWQFNEPWPTICWSLIDYYMNPKMAYWTVKQAFKGIIINYDKMNEKIIVTNDFNQNINGEVTARNYTITGSIISDKKIDTTIQPNGKTEIKYKNEIKDKNTFLWLKFSNKTNNCENLYLPDDPVNIDIPNPDIEISLDKNKNELILVSQSLAFITILPSEIKPQDNYFHLIPNVKRRVKVNTPPSDSFIELSVWKFKKKKIKITNLR